MKRPQENVKNLPSYANKVLVIHRLDIACDRQPDTSERSPQRLDILNRPPFKPIAYPALASHWAMSANPRLHEADPPRRWSIASFNLPLPIVGWLLIQTVAGTLYMDRRFSKIETAIEQQKADSNESYRKDIAAKDLQMRDDHITELRRRIEVIECHMDGRRCGQ